MNLEEIIKQATQYAENMPKHQKIFEVYEGELIKHVKGVLSTELSPESYKIASKRIPSINLMNKIIKKLSQAYKESPKRTTLDSSDQEILNSYENDLNINTVMGRADTLLNLSRSFALEPYVDNGEINLRVLKPDQFMVISNSKTDPTKPTIFVKFMGSVEKEGKRQFILWIYTKDEFIRAYSDGSIIDRNPNPYSQIPIIYGKSNSFLIQPQADTDFYENALLIPRILSDLNYAVQFQSHSRVYGIDIDPTKVNISADSMTIFQSRDGDGENIKPELGMITPSVDVDKVLSLCKFTIANILDTKGIKATGLQSLDSSNIASGVSKIIDSADVSQVVQENQIILADCERRLWSLIGEIHNLQLSTADFKYSKGLESPFKVTTSFPVQKPIPDPGEQRESLKFQLEQGLITKKRALQKLNPDMTDQEIDQLMTELTQPQGDINE